MSGIWPKTDTKFIVTLDEAYVYLSDTGGKRSIYYVDRNKVNEKNFVKFRERHPKGFMIVAAVSYNGKIHLSRIDPKVKMNSKIYCKDVLKPLLGKISQKYHEDDLEQVWFHQDLASSHFSKMTVATLDQLTDHYGINYIPKADIPVKSPDIALMDFCVFGLLKQAIWKHQPKDVEDLWKVTKSEWRKMSMATIKRALISWKV